MDNTEARSILSGYRLSEPGPGDARFEEARRQAETDPALAQWWKEEQELDRLIGSKLEAVPVPAGLKTRLLNATERRATVRAHWPRKLTMLAASIVLLAVFFGSWRGFFHPATSLADYRDEMVSFIRLDPSLDLGSSDMTQVNAFLKENGAPAVNAIPAGLRQLNPVGCRTLRFRGQNVTLLCFQRGPDDFVHLFLLDQKGFLRMKSNGTKADYAKLGEWMTATWSNGDQVYLLTARSSQEALEKYLGTS